MFKPPQGSLFREQGREQSFCPSYRFITDLAQVRARSIKPTLLLARMLLSCTARRTGLISPGGYPHTGLGLHRYSRCHLRSAVLGPLHGLLLLPRALQEGLSCVSDVACLCSGSRSFTFSPLPRSVLLRAAICLLRHNFGFHVSVFVLHTWPHEGKNESDEKRWRGAGWGRR
jgi:hypothetical protein